MPRNPPPQHLTEQKQSHESLGIQRCREGARRFRFVFTSVSIWGLCVVRLLISAHLGSLFPSPGGVAGRHLRHNSPLVRLVPLTFLYAHLKQLNISLHSDWHGTHSAACDSEQAVLVRHSTRTQHMSSQPWFTAMWPFHGVYSVTGYKDLPEW